MERGKYIFRGLKGDLQIQLYKYYSNYNYAIDAIQNKRIYLTKPSDFNDIYDSASYFTEDSLKRLCNTSYNICQIMKGFLPSRYHYALEDCQSKVDKDPFSIYDVIEYLCGYDDSFQKKELVAECIFGTTRGALVQADNNKISCFSEKWDSLLMWAYYANSGAGVCLGFDFTLDKGLKAHCHKVQYSNDFILGPLNFDHYFRKSEQWSHEQEWRIVCDTKEEFIPTASLTTIILGCRIPPERHSVFLELGKENNLNVYKIFPSTERYELMLKPIFIDGSLIG